MSSSSAIEWTDFTWNPVAGCSVASAGCTNCYAMRMAARLEAMGHSKYAGTTRQSGKRSVWTGRVNIDESRLDEPRGWRRGRRVFVNSMSDLFHHEVPAWFIKRVFQTMQECPQHQFQVLTKRPERMASFFEAGELPKTTNVWVGTSVEDAAVANRIDELRVITGMTLFVSFEPLIGPVGLVDLQDIH